MTKSGLARWGIVLSSFLIGGIATVINPTVGATILGAMAAHALGDAFKGIVGGALNEQEKTDLTQNLMETSSNLKEDNKNFKEIYNKMLDNIQDPLLSRLVADVFNPEDMKKYDGSKLLGVQLKYIEKTLKGSTLSNDEKRDALLKLIDFCKDYNEKVEKTPDRAEQRKESPDSLLPAERSMCSLIATYYIMEQINPDFTIDQFKNALLNRGVNDILDTRQYNPDVLKVVLKDMGVDKDKIENIDGILANKNLEQLKDPSEKNTETKKIEKEIKFEKTESKVLSYEEYEKMKAENGKPIKDEGDIEVVDRNNGKDEDDGSDKKQPEDGESKNKDAVDADFSDYGDYGEK